MMRAFVDRAIRRGAAALALVLALLSAGPTTAQVTGIGSGGNAEAGRIEARDEGRYSRVVFSFDRRPRHQLSAQNGILVIRFERAVDLPVEALTRELRGFISSARRDPDGTAIRIALSRKVRVNSSEAGDQLFIDFMPEPWVGPPPPLPPEVMAELQRRAEEAERLKRDQQARERRRALRAPIELVVGEAPTFTRLEFRSRDRVEATISRSSREVRVTFERVGDVDLGPIRARLPRFLDAIRTEDGDDRLIVVLGVDGVRDVRGFEESNAYVVDIIGPDRGTVEFRSDGQLRAPAASGAEQSILIRGAPRPDGAEREQRPDPPQARPDPPPRMEAPARAQPSQQRSERAVPVPPDRPQALARAPTPAPPPGAAFAVAAGVAETTGSIPAPLPVVAVQGLREDHVLRVRLPFDEPTPAAVFARGQSLWMVFTTPRRLDAATLQRDLGPRVRSVATVQARGHSILRLDLEGSFLVTTQATGPEWTVTVADAVASPPRALVLTPRSLADGRSSVEIDLQRAGQVHRIEDPIVGDQLLIATATAPTAGLLRAQTFVDFHLLASAQGVALKPFTDDLVMRHAEDVLVVEREAGLQLSFVGTRRAAVVAPQAQGGPRLGFVDFEGWKFGATDGFVSIRDQLLARAAVTTGVERRNARLDLARFNIAYMLAHEALIVLALVRQDEPLFEADPVFRFLRGVSNVLAFRSDLADRDLSLSDFTDIADVAMWRGMIAERAGQWASARRLLERARAVIPTYPRHIQAKALGALAASALELNDLGAVQATLEEMRGLENTPAFRARLALLSARVAEAQGRREEAIAGYRAAEVDGAPADRASAQFRRIALQSELGLITASDAARQLMSLSYDWRGDQLEPQLYARLVDIHLTAARIAKPSTPHAAPWSRCPIIPCPGSRRTRRATASSPCSPRARPTTWSRCRHSRSTTTSPSSPPPAGAGTRSCARSPNG